MSVNKTTQTPTENSLHYICCDKSFVNMITFIIYTSTTVDLPGSYLIEK